MNQGLHPRLVVATGWWRAKRQRVMTGLLCMAAACCPVVTAQDDPDQVRRQIELVRGQIATLQQQLAQADKDHRAEVDRLRAAETALSETGRRIGLLSDEIEATARQLEQLEAEEKGLDRSLNRQQALLADQLRAAHRMGGQPALRMLLSVDRLPALGRMLTFYRLFNQARLAQLQALREALLRLAAVRQQLQTLRDRQQASRDDLLARQQAQQVQRVERQRAIASLRNAIASDQQRLAQLATDQERLEQLLTELQSLFADIPGALDAAADFTTLKGQLGLPVDGRMVLPPGRAKPGGRHRLGLLIEASPGATVRAISHGRVAFADWLRGFGLLTIVDHGGGYLSLYAGAEVLYREAGDWVGTGDRLATVGEGNPAGRGLYFELRLNGQPIDPRPWWRG